ncbi:hypothetical protein PNEG_02120 [Pneumocystis murina B123]|uniref:Origin recognition complex subunit 1 n=1 Tax=Pneumocystis murina (strain B123) TaxID=1069680 RepID=M7PGF2_PNEMU|nr:hypothetical protein PNEG_02120 [Pneumocystis murina B123]EMR09534.1 hypothetical protein PNEG_02120 [Pneumocystis murina B123]
MPLKKSIIKPYENDFEWIGKGIESSEGIFFYKAVCCEKETFYIGDCILVRSNSGKGSWAAMITCFYETKLGEKMADLLWFERSTHIRREKQRHPICHSELFICGTKDSNELSVFQRKIQVISYDAFIKRYPKGLTRYMNDYDKVFYCRSGFHSRKEIYLDFIDWDQFYRHQETDFDALIAWVNTTCIQACSVQKHSKHIEVDESGADELVKEETVSENDVENSDIEDIYMPVESDESSDIINTEDDESINNTFSNKTPHKRGKSTPKLVTPVSGRRMTSGKRRCYKKHLEMTPLPLRYLFYDKSQLSPYQSARSRLHVSTVPMSLPCREREFSLIYSQVLNALEAGHGECIYISGPPGTGKTVTIKEVVRCLFQKVDEGEIDDFKYVEINGMRMIDPNHAYTLLWEALTEERVTSRHALMLLEKRFSQPSPNRVPCVVMIDELDQLVTKDQKLMYNFFNWPALQYSRLIVISIANTMDLPERMLTNKISSRLGLTRIGFSGYTFDQLQVIIRTRLQGIPGHLMDQDAIELASRKVSAISGDARRALDICRRAVEIAEISVTTNEKSSLINQDQIYHGKITMKTIQRAISELSASPVQTYLRTIPLAYKVFLISLMLKMKRSGLSTHKLGEIIDICLRMCKTTEKLCLQEFYRLSIDIDLNLINSAFALAEAGIIFFNTNGGKRQAHVQLKIAPQDVQMALQDDIDFRGILT